MKSILEELDERKILKQFTNQEKIKNIQKNRLGVYCGFDPTADSLHIGHLVQIINLVRFKKYGFQPIALIGGATGMIGDPSFKSKERVLLDSSQVAKNVSGIEKQLEKIIPDIEIVNNNSWYEKMNLLTFLRDVGKNFNISYLLAKENISTRISSGLSVTEFMYTLLQAYDFLKLYQDKKCYMQIGGSDQWGNIVSGIDLINSVLNNKSEVAGLTFNLVTKKDGQKFGKSEGGAIWLDSSKTSEYELYQYLFNQDDQDCENLLLSLTTLELSEIKKIIEEQKVAPFKRLAQKKLAEQVVLLIHGQKGLDKALKITNAFFNGSIKELTKDEFQDLTKNYPLYEVENNLNIIDLLVKTKIVSSKREGREFIENKALRLNDELVDLDKKISENDTLFNNLLILKKGKKSYYIIKIVR